MFEYGNWKRCYFEWECMQHFWIIHTYWSYARIYYVFLFSLPPFHCFTEEINHFTVTTMSKAASCFQSLMIVSLFLSLSHILLYRWAWPRAEKNFHKMGEQASYEGIITHIIWRRQRNLIWSINTFTGFHRCSFILRKKSKGQIEYGNILIGKVILKLNYCIY